MKSKNSKNGEAKKTTRSAFAFSQHAFIDNLTRIQSVQHDYKDLAARLSETTINADEVNIASLLADPHTELLRFLPDDTQQFIANLASPAAYNWGNTEFVHVIAWVANINAVGRGSQVVSNAHHYNLSTGELKDGVEEKLRASCTTFTQNDIQETVFQKVQAAAALLNEAQLIAGPWLDRYGDRIALVEPFIRIDTNYEVNSQFISKFENR